MKQMVFHLQGRDTTLARTGNEVDSVNQLLNGDADFDGQVGPGDFNLLASHFGQTNQTWATGDFDYDGTTGPGDFNLLASRFGSALPPVQLRAAGETSGSATTDSNTSVPVAEQTLATPLAVQRRPRAARR
jgi:hypothetical protein